MSDVNTHSSCLRPEGAGSRTDRPAGRADPRREGGSAMGDRLAGKVTIVTGAVILADGGMTAK
jgi:hypothetical protein